MKSLQIHQPGYQPLYHIKPLRLIGDVGKALVILTPYFAHTFCLLNQTFALINLDHERKCLFIFRGGIGIDNC